MNLINAQKKSLLDYKAVIFDLDGTLYYQRPFRIKMVLYLAAHMLTHPSGIKDILLIKKYREVRENWEKLENDSFCKEDKNPDKDLDSRQYEYVAEVKRVSPECVRETVSFFMFEAPLKLLPSYRDDRMLALMDELRGKGVKVVVYSDYPVEAKLNALGAKADICFTSADEAIGCMKPNPKGIRVILETLGLRPDEAVMIGDRYEKDGIAAKENQMDYVIVSASPKERRKIVWHKMQNIEN